MKKIPISKTVRYRVRVTIHEKVKKGKPKPVIESKKKAVTGTIKDNRGNNKGYKKEINYGDEKIMVKNFYVKDRDEAKRILSQEFNKVRKGKSNKSVTSTVQKFKGKIKNPHNGQFSSDSEISKGAYTFNRKSGEPKRDYENDITEMLDKVDSYQEYHDPLRKKSLSKKRKNQISKKRHNRLKKMGQTNEPVRTKTKKGKK